RHAHEALSAAMKIVVNSAYGYLAAPGLTRFADVHAANEVTRRGRDLLALLCRELAARGVTLLEADTDGVYFAVPEHTTETDERRELAYEALLAGGRESWAPGDRVRVYRALGGRPVLVEEGGEDDVADEDARDYDVEHYVRQLRDNYATRLSRALTAEDHAAVVAAPEQLSLFPRDLAAARPI